MKFKVSTLKFYYVKDTQEAINDIKQTYKRRQFYPAVVDYNDEIDLSYLKINESVLVIAIKNKESFEKQVICNAYNRIN